MINSAKQRRGAFSATLRHEVHTTVDVCMSVIVDNSGYHVRTSGMLDKACRPRYKLGWGLDDVMHHNISGPRT